MKIAYVILAHRYPEQLLRLIDRLTYPGASFFIHIDGKASDEMYFAIADQLKHRSNVFFLKRHRCHWGDFGIVKATIEAIKQVVKSGVEFDYALLLSGQDYLIKPVDQFKEFLERNNGQEFIEHFALHSKNKWTEQGGAYQALNRVQHWHFRLRSKHFYLAKKRRFLEGFEPYGGTQWWCLSRNCIEYINTFLANNPAFINYFKYVFVPDEVFFQTVLGNSPFRTHMVNDDLKYADWENPNAGYPAVLGKNDFTKLLNSSKFFARKFDSTRDSEILDLIDQKMLNLSVVK